MLIRPTLALQFHSVNVTKGRVHTIKIQDIDYNLTSFSEQIRLYETKT